MVGTVPGGGTGDTIVGCKTYADIAYTYNSTTGGLKPAGVATATCTTPGITVA